jgi:hypothetical protein
VNSLKIPNTSDVFTSSSLLSCSSALYKGCEGKEE